MSETTPTESTSVSDVSTETLSAGERLLVSEHYFLIERVVLGMRHQLAAHADLEELQSVGLLGLIRAVRNFDQARQSSFKSYAVLRIRGAVLDELRRMDWMTRTGRQKKKAVEEAVQELEQKLGRVPYDEEVRAHLKLGQRDYSRLRRQTQQISFVSLDHDGIEADSGGRTSLHEQIADENQLPGFESLEAGELVEILVDEMEQLPERQRKVLAFYYHEKLKLSEIAAVFGVTEARICQIHTQALQMLKVAIVKRQEAGKSVSLAEV